MIDAEYFFLNNGDTIFQTKNYCHCYRADEIDMLVTDFKWLLAGNNSSAWDGNEPEHRIFPASLEAIDEIGYTTLEWLIDMRANKNHPMIKGVVAHGNSAKEFLTKIGIVTPE